MHFLEVSRQIGCLGELLFTVQTVLFDAKMYSFSVELQDMFCFVGFSTLFTMEPCMQAPLLSWQWRVTGAGVMVLQLRLCQPSVLTAILGSSVLQLIVSSVLWLVMETIFWLIVGSVLWLIMGSVLWLVMGSAL